MEDQRQYSPHYSDLQPVRLSPKPQYQQLSDLPPLVVLQSEGAVFELVQEASRGLTDFAHNLAQCASPPQHPQSPARPYIARSYSPSLPDITSSDPRTPELVSQQASYNIEEELGRLPPLKKELQPTQFRNNPILVSEALNLGVSSFNYYYTLNFDHVVELITSASRIHITLYGLTKFSAIGSAISPLYSFYHYGLAWALPHAAIAACFMFLPTGNLLGTISVASASYGLWTTYQANYGDQYYQASLQSYKVWAETSKFSVEKARISFLIEFFANKVKEYEKEIVTLQNIIKKNEYKSCIGEAEQVENRKIKLGGSVAKAIEEKKEAFKECESLLPLELPAENAEQEVSGAQWKYKTDL